MRSFRALVFVLVAVLSLGGALSAAAPAFAAEPACHESSHDPADNGRQTPAPVAVNCCAGCLPAPSQMATAVDAALAPAARAPVPPARRLESLARAPEPHPPRHA